MSVAYNEKEELKVKIESPKQNFYQRPSEKELADCRPCRLCLVGSFLILLIGLLVASIVLIAVTDKCSKELEKESKENAVIYQVYVKSFKDTDGDGFGDFNGVKSKLEHIKKAGANKIILNDIVSQVDFMLAKNIGTLDDFKDLLKVCKESKLKVLVQLNPVVVSSLNQWFLQSKNGTAKRDWFIWRQKNATNNWLTGTNASAWHESDDVFNETFYSHYGKDKPTLNYYSSEVIDAMKNKLTWWMDMGVNGFMFTGVSRLAVDNKYRSNGDVIYDKDTFRSHGTLRVLYKTVNSKDGLVYVVPRTTVEKSLKYFGSRENREADIVLNDDLALLKTIDVKLLNETLTGYLGSAPSFGSVGWMAGGSSYQRLASRFNTAEAKLLSLFVLVLPRTVLSYYGDELLLEDTDGKSNSIMKWNDESNAGFTKDSATPWLKITGSYNPTPGYANISSIRSSLDAFKYTPTVVYAEQKCIVMVYNDKVIVGVNFKNKIEMVTNATKITKGRYLFSTDTSKINKEIDLKKPLAVAALELFMVELVD